MVTDTLTALTAVLTSKVAKDALAKAIEIYKSKRGSQTYEFHTEDSFTNIDNYYLLRDGKKNPRIKEIEPWTGEGETPIGAARSTREVLTTQLTILEKERNRLIPVVTREHWVALIFVVIAGIVFFTSISLFIFATLAKGIPTLLASMIPGFLGKTFFKREANIEKRLREISSDLRASEKAKERLEIIEEALKVIPEEYRERVLEDFTKTKPTKPELKP
jgi:hypothetical protein